MRFLLKAEWPVEEGNAAIKDGSLPKTIQSILEDIKSEATYFLAANGKRTVYNFINLEDPSQIPEVCEPWFLKFNASIDIVPVMVPEDLMRAGPAIEQAVMKYGRE
jgi:hypothetical protein